MTDTVDRVAMRFTDIASSASLLARDVHDKRAFIAAALSSHGLREAVLKVECGQEPDAVGKGCPYCADALTALLGEGETLKEGGAHAG